MMVVDDISEIVAKRLNLSSVQVREINRIQWKMLHKEMQSGDFKSVNIFYVGKFSKKKPRPEKYINGNSKGDI